MTYALGLLGAAAVLVVVIELLRRRHLRGKYALLYLILAIVITVFAVLPGFLDATASALGVQIPANLLFFGASVTLLLVTMQLSYEAGRLEERTRTLAEEVGLIRMELDALRDRPEQ